MHLDKRACSKLEYFDKLKQKCRDFPGGGYLVIMDHSTKCAHGDSGLHTFSRRDYYYVCNPDGVMIGLCPDNTVFSDTEKRCITHTSVNIPSTIKVHDEAQNKSIAIPDCNGVGLFPIPSNCSFYFRCQEHNYNFHQYVYQCPSGTFFHPDLQKCSSSNKCYDGHEDILYRFNTDYFPECQVHGQFRTAKDCTLYYRCVPNMDGSFYQIRYECPYQMYYNIDRELCMPDHFQYCEYISQEKIVQDYKRKHDLANTTCDPQPTTVISALNTHITSIAPVYYGTTQPVQIDEGLSLITDGYGDSPSGNEASTRDPYQLPSDLVGDNIEQPDLTVESQSTQSDSTPEEVEPIITASPEKLDADPEPASEQLPDETVDEKTTDNTMGSQPTNTADDAATTNPPVETDIQSFSPEDRSWICDLIDCDLFEFDNEAMEFRRRAQPAEETTSEMSEITPTPATETPASIYAIVSAPPSTPYYQEEPQSTIKPASIEIQNDPVTDAGEPESHEDKTYEASEQNMEQESSLDPGPELSENSTMYLEMDASNLQEPPEIMCNATRDGEIECDGGRISSEGMLQIPGYEIKLRVWQDFSDRYPDERKPKISVHLILEYPINYVLEAYAKEYRPVPAETENQLEHKTPIVQNDSE
ncbi:uncharacterized protein LOC118464530 [Anopheles albimanus]|uniref:uncharacterized protein LOC118464530 n=1 Tax=Anopheles albimanus TaxID=7167 RepID=UPI00163F8A79|nr:uncharacterized protein LOC118464530 [Anopheles albimanus]